MSASAIAACVMSLFTFNAVVDHFRDVTGPLASAEQTTSSSISVESEETTDELSEEVATTSSVDTEHIVNLDEATTTAYRNLNQANGKSALATAGITLSDMQRAELMQWVDNMREQGYQVSFAAVNMRDGGVVEAYGDMPMYSASAIKALYVLALAQTGALPIDIIAKPIGAESTYYQRLVTQTLQLSDNDAYQVLYDTFGEAPMKAWVQGIGVADDITGYYGDISAADIARMWVKGYDYLFGDAPGSGSQSARQWLAQQMTGSMYSAISLAHSDSNNTVFSKAGWINGQGGFYACNDAGIVLPNGAKDVDNHPQGSVIAIMTNAAGKQSELMELVSVLGGVLE